MGAKAIFLVTCTALLASAAHAAERDYPIGETITGVKASRGVNVALSPGAGASAVAETDDEDDFSELKIDIDDGVLKISRRSNFTDENSTRFTVRVVLERFDYLNVTTGATLEAGAFALGDLEAKVDTGGVAEISGTCDDLDAQAATGGVFRAGALVCDGVDASASTGGVITAHAKERTKAKARLGGEVTVHGGPEKVRSNTFLGGDVTITN